MKTKENYGTKYSTTPSINVEKENNKIILQFSPDAFGNPETLNGSKIYVTTWDCNGVEGGYHRMTKAGEVWKFGGSDDPNPVRIIDEIEVSGIN